MRPDPAPACPSTGDLAGYVDASLRGAAAAAAYEGLRGHLSTCAECATIVAMAVTGMRWRETGAPGAAARLPEPAWIGLDRAARESYCGG